MTPRMLWLVATIMMAAWFVALRSAHADDDIGSIAEGAIDDGASDDGAAPAATGKPDAWVALGQDVRVRKVVVSGFDGKGALRLRQAVLDALSEHTEVEVIGAKDVEVSAKSLGHSTSDRSGRTALSAELGIYAWVQHDEGKGSIVLVDAEGEQLAALPVAQHGGSEADLRVKIWSTFGPHVSDQGLRMRLLERLRMSASGKLKAVEEETLRQSELAMRREERRASHLAASRQRATTILQAQQAEVDHQQQQAVARIQRAKQEQALLAEQARQDELARQAQLAQQAEAARQAELAQQMELGRQAELARQQQAQHAAMAKQAPPPQPAYVQQPAYAAYPAANDGAWQPGRTQPVFAAPTPAPAPQPAYAEPAYAQPAYAPQPAPPVAADPSAAMPVSPATAQWLERRRLQQQQGGAR